VVLIHEMGGTLESWDGVAPLLARHRRVLRYDTRGAGLSQKARGALSIDMTEDLAALMDGRWRARSRAPHLLESGHYMAAQTPELLAGAIAEFLDQAGV
jgi:pimeloyl-ACP methyl ester carboxylesterase